MSRAGDEEDEDERFYESIDRLLSSASSCCSLSTTDDEQDRDLNSIPGSPNSDSPIPLLPVPRFPVGVTNNYDVWISEPSSIEERRRRLLTQMGLSRDPILSRHRSSPSSTYDGGASGRLPEGDVGRSASAYQLNSSTRQLDEVSRAKSSLSIVRSRSDGAVDDLGNSCPHDQCNSSSSLNTSIISINSISPPVIQTTGGASVNSHCVVKSESGKGLAAVENGTSVSKPPTGKNVGRSEEIRDDLSSSNANADNGGDLDDGSSCNGIVPVNDPVCTIKNLDNGEEFVVNEVREDGMWNKLKEVGTGKQLTMEEFEICVGHSPIVQELMRRQNVEDGNRDSVDSNANGIGGSGPKLKKKGSWLKSLRIAASSMTGQKERRSSDERDTSSEKGGRRSSSATDDSQDVPFHGPEKIRVRQYGKSCKELSGLYKSQEIHAHNGSIWAIKFSLDGKYLASAGEDCVIHIWQVGEIERKGDLLTDRQEDGNVLLAGNGSPRPGSVSKFDIYPEKKRRGRSSVSRKSVSLDPVMVPETVFALTEKPILSLQGHLDDVLDLSWSKSQHLLSSSMDKTVRLWHLSSMSCLKIFSHSDYVTCIQFNPVDDNYFISGSLDAKVRIWSIPDRQVVDWIDLHEMVTAACYTPDGRGALVGSYKGSCRSYNTFGNKLQQECQINLQNRRKKSHHRKITGFEFAPGSSSEVIITSADSRIRVVNGEELVHKFKGFRNPHSQISASLTTNGKYVLCASEDSHVYVWKHESDSRPSRSKGVTVTHSYEHFYCQDVSVAIPWPGMWDPCGFQDHPCSGELNRLDDHLEEAASTANHPPTPVEEMMGNGSSPLLPSLRSNSPLHGTISSATNSYFFDRITATWPEEKLLVATKAAAAAATPRVSFDLPNGLNQSRAAWGMVIVTASLKGEIRTFQNFGLPVRI